MKQQYPLVLLPCLLSACAPVSHAKRAGSLPKQLTSPSLSRGHNKKNVPQQLQDAPPRGGGAVKALYTPGRVPIELNPNYVPPQWRSQSKTVSSSTYSSAGFSHEETPYTAVVQETTLAYENTASAATATSAVRDYRAGWSAAAPTNYHLDSTWLQNLKIQFLSMFRSSPSLTATMVACVAVFLAWQVQPRAAVLHQYFVLSRASMQHAIRWPSVFLSAVSHMDIWHLLVNLYGLWSLGPVVERSLNQVGQPLGPFLIGAAAASSLAFLLLQRVSGAGGALGLSGVTLALLAVYARIRPTAVMGVRLAGIIPVRIKAENVIVCLGVWSLVGAISAVRSNLGHAAHLGGLLFGVAYHQLVLSRKSVSQPLWQYQP